MVGLQASSSMLKRYTLQNSDPHRGAQSYTARECLGDMSAVTPEFTQLLRDSWDDFLVCFNLSLHTEVILGVKKRFVCRRPRFVCRRPTLLCCGRPNFFVIYNDKTLADFFLRILGRRPTVFALLRFDVFVLFHLFCLFCFILILYWNLFF